ncbi:phage integrase N-terminal domain-containing protein [Paenibacillus sp. 1A_MP2]|uniref:phage integrase N-terminal domain-containing protein n=1 Tax=Paenibacillus sp. 1A_MP2 TaxID=3457495 RepID=UPI003FCCC379
MGKSTVEVQIEKIFKHTRQGSYATRDRYKDSCLMFARFCLDRFKMQNIRNIHDKHIAAFIQERLSQVEPRTIKGDLSALRYMHDQIQRPRYELSDNAKLQEDYGLTIGTTHQVNGDRAWTTSEYDGMMQIAKDLGNSNVADCMQLSRTMGLRITEAAAVSRAQAEYALRTGIYQVKGEAKNGKHREVPLSAAGRLVLERRMSVTSRENGCLSVRVRRRIRLLTGCRSLWCIIGIRY